MRSFNTCLRQWKGFRTRNMCQLETFTCTSPIQMTRTDLEKSEQLLETAEELLSKVEKEAKKLKTELETVKEEKKHSLKREQMLSEEKNKILSELERSKEEEEKSEIAMQSLASALHQEASKLKETLLSLGCQDYETHIEDLKLVIKSTNLKYEKTLHEVEITKKQFESSMVDWEMREAGLVNHVKKFDEEVSSMGKEMNRLGNLVKRAMEEAAAALKKESEMKDDLKDVEDEPQPLPLPQSSSFYAFVPPLISDKKNSNNNDNGQFEAEDSKNLERILREASTAEKTVIVTMMNQAYADLNSTFDVFLEGFQVGDGTEKLLRHVLVDMDTVWLRDPFPRLIPDVDFQIACDRFNGNSSDTRNYADGGFKFVVANHRTIEFYNYWYESRLRYPGNNEQDVINKIKGNKYLNKIGLKMRFLDTTHVGNFCQRNWDITKVCVMHGNCCIGQDNKIKDLRQVLDDWTAYFSNGDRAREFRQPMNCWRSLRRQYNKERG
ncbi:hypothetical protein IGI04_026285 [Brassica rapa subsp. trilocularis]|uniref:Nucleotide-diphospho-sugar transferase domain-containing protein n=1 Tax=Brassica rapa subsp. trilocularis TaxID=1813537 RepID=A0ABQ7KVK3_BRACM|nr:hypothetical protein IGI04_026285 [Brassica rapa subsp. trilocularis]